MTNRYLSQKIVLNLDKNFSSMDELKYAVITRLQNEGFNCKDTKENVGFYPLLKINAKNFMLTLKDFSEQKISFKNCNEVILVPQC